MQHEARDSAQSTKVVIAQERYRCYGRGNRDINHPSTTGRFTFRNARTHHSSRVEENYRLVYVADEGQNLVGVAVRGDEMHRMSVSLEGSESTIRHQFVELFGQAFGGALTPDEQ